MKTPTDSQTLPARPAFVPDAAPCDIFPAPAFIYGRAVSASNFETGDFSQAGQLPCFAFRVIFTNGSRSGWRKGFHSRLDAEKAGERAAC